MEEHETFLCTSKHPISALKHKAEIRVWEKKLHQETSERSIEKLIGIADKQIKECFKVLPQHGKYRILCNYMNKVKMRSCVHKISHKLKLCGNFTAAHFFAFWLNLLETSLK